MTEIYAIVTAISVNLFVRFGQHWTRGRCHQLGHSYLRPNHYMFFLIYLVEVDYAIPRGTTATLSLYPKYLQLST